MKSKQSLLEGLTQPFVDLNPDLLEIDVKFIEEKLQLSVLKKKVLLSDHALIRENLIYPIGLYTGQVLNNKKSGLGIFFFFNSMKYHGYWLEDLPHGLGILEFPNCKYKGDFCKGHFQGFGKFTSNSYKYKGTWKNNEKSGKGSEFFFNKPEQYSGEFLNNLRHGAGLLKIRDSEYQVKYINGNLATIEQDNGKPIKVQKAESNKYNVSAVQDNGKILELVLDLNTPLVPLITFNENQSRAIRLSTHNQDPLIH